MINQQTEGLKDADILIANVLHNPTLYGRFTHVSDFDFETKKDRDIWNAISRLVFEKTKPTADNIHAIENSITADYLLKICGNISPNPAQAQDSVARMTGKRRAIASIDILRQGIQKIEATLLRQDKGSDTKPVPVGTPATWQEIIGDVARQAIKMTTENDAMDASIVREDILINIGQRKTRFPTKIKRFDDFFEGGPVASNYIAIGAQTKVGKTTLAASISFNWEAQGIKHCFISAERSHKDVERMKIARSMKTSASKVDEAGDEEWLNMMDDPIAFERYCQYYHRPGMTLENVVTTIMNQVYGRDTHAFLIDYWQLIDGRGRDSISSHMTKVAQILGNLCNDLNIVILIFVQMTDFGEPFLDPSIKQSANSFLVIQRDMSAKGAFFETRANNLGPFHNIGGIQDPCMILDTNGPHFRDLTEEDEKDERKRILIDNQRLF